MIKIILHIILLIAFRVYSYTIDDVEELNNRFPDSFEDQLAWKTDRLYDRNMDGLIKEYNTDDYDSKIVEAKRDDVMNSKDKKSPPLCTIKKVLRTHPDDGFEYHPKHFHDYECVPVYGDFIGSEFTDQGTCRAHSCQPVEKYHGYLKRKMGQKCWNEFIRIKESCYVQHTDCITLEKSLMFARQKLSGPSCGLEPHEKVVKVGCHCIHHIKHHYH